MTALAGFWSFDGRPVHRPCRRVLDGQKIYGQHLAQVDDDSIALGRNLFPCLPEDKYDRGPQSRAGFRMVADVRLDNRRELLAELGLQSRDAHSLPDAALLFESLLKWGEPAVDRFVGEFAFAFWDEAKQELLLGRDFLGMRPLHFHRGNGFFAFASMPSELHALEEVPYELDVDFMIHSLALAPLADGRSYFREIERVEPGHLVRVTRSSLRQISYWDPSGTPSTKPEDCVEGLRALFDDVVTAQLRGSGDVVATQLSAGLDSSAVTATVARQHGPGKVFAFTAVPRPGFDGPSPPGSIANEAALAAATARLYANVEHILNSEYRQIPAQMARP